METIVTIFLVAVIPALFFGDPRDWGKSDLEKDYEKDELGGGLFAWIICKLGSVATWSFILVGLFIAFAIIKVIWKLA